VSDDTQDLLKGTLDMLILQALEHAPMHGWGVAERIEASSRAVFRLQTGTLYPSLHRLLRQGRIVAEWQTTENNRRARFYRLTPRGRRQVTVEISHWRKLVHAVNQVIDPLTS
jgi:transcriptional regulator